MKGIEIRPTKNKKDLEEVFKIREIVFQKGQKVSKERDHDGLDKVADHIIVLQNKKTTGCARIRFIGKTAKLERIAILEKYHGKGYGKMLTEYLISYCKKKKAKQIILHSQYYVKDFYAKCGFEERGKPFTDADIRHIEMRMKL